MRSNRQQWKIFAIKTTMTRMLIILNLQGHNYLTVHPVYRCFDS